MHLISFPFLHREYDTYLLYFLYVHLSLLSTLSLSYIHRHLEPQPWVKMPEEECASFAANPVVDCAAWRRKRALGDLAGGGTDDDGGDPKRVVRDVGGDAPQSTEEDVNDVGGAGRDYPVPRSIAASSPTAPSRTDAIIASGPRPNLPS